MRDETALAMQRLDDISREVPNYMLGSPMLSRAGIEDAQSLCYWLSYRAGNWTPSKDGDSLSDISRNTLSPKVEACRVDLERVLSGLAQVTPDPRLPHRHQAEVHMAAALITLLDIAGALDFDLGGALVELLDYESSPATV